MYSVQVCSLLGLLVAFIAFSQANPSGRLLYGQSVDNIRQFPHHVSITVSDSGRKCGGSIINKHWILTSASCVKHSIRLDLYFKKKHEYDKPANYFSISVNREQVFVYPTNYDDIALVRVPITLDFSESLAPVNISKLPIEALRGRFTVMPGFSDFQTTTPKTTTFSTTTTPKTTTFSTTTTFHGPPTPVPISSSSDSSSTSPSSTYSTPAASTTYSTTSTTQKTTTASTSTTPCFGCPSPPTAPPVTYDPSHGQEKRTDNLKYGMFNVLENRVCKKIYGGAFDEYTQLCIDTWGDNPNRPCDSDYGSGLIVGWPSRSELVGLFSMYSPSCENKNPSIFTFVGKYTGWIESLTRG